MSRPAIPPGHRVPLGGGAWAHVPAPLPPALDWTPVLVAALSEAARLKVVFTTAQRAVAKREELKIVRQVNEAMRDRVYCATGLLKILEEPAKVAAKQHA